MVVSPSSASSGDITTRDSRSLSIRPSKLDDLGAVSKQVLPAPRYDNTAFFDTTLPVSNPCKKLPTRLQVIGFPRAVQGDLPPLHPPRLGNPSTLLTAMSMVSYVPEGMKKTTSDEQHQKNILDSPQALSAFKGLVEGLSSLPREK